jgi:hypothetical protein
MGERTPRIDDGPAPQAESEPKPRAMTEALGSEIAVVRGELDGLFAELDRRRHEALDVRHQLSHHALGAGLTLLALVATAAAGVWLGIWRHRRRSRVLARVGRLQHAFARMTEHPERVAAEPTIAGKIATAAANAAVATLVKKLLERGVQSVLDQRPSADAAAPRPVAGRGHRMA